ncbi:hypothetical protein BZL29_6876 [Mycobacterium kansasii]|uniref:Uncharacterized protein n=1 Tax=Mycobacterium kansasii TaxID=1768 RepID=A0A1V3WPQ9_MYCKA|nr:hypothetical protein BZL29_6876 [Mycobacterium kansasii]
MHSGRPLAALVATLVGVMLSGAPAAHADQPAFVVNPISHVDTLIGTGTGGETVGEINNFPGPRCRSAWCSTRRTPPTPMPATTTTTSARPDSA